MDDDVRDDDVMDRGASGRGRLSGTREFGREILDAVPGGAVIAFDPEMRITFAEGRELQKLPHETGTLEGRLLSEALPEGVWNSVKGPCERALKGEAVSFETVQAKTIYSVKVTPLTDGGSVTGAIAVSHSISEQKGLELLLRDSERLLATAFDRAPIGMSVVDFDYRIVRVNDSFCGMFGYTREELLEMPYDDLIHPDDVDQDIDWLQRAREGQTDSFDRDKKFISKSGSIVWVHARSETTGDSDGRADYTINMLEDITASRQARLDLLARDRELRMVLDNIPDEVSVKGRDLRYSLVNKAFEMRFGVTRDDVIGHRSDEVLPSDGIAEDRASHAEVLRTGQSIQHEEMLPVGGESHTFQTTKFPLRDENDEIYAVGGVFNDITDRKRRDEEFENRLAWTEEIQSAIDQNRLVLHGQPIINLTTGEVVQAELLVRMMDRRKPETLLAPGVFLPAAERFGLIRSIDQWVVAHALEVAIDHRVEINLSGVTISDPEQVNRIEAMVAESSAPPDNIVFEITETAVAGNLSSARRFAERLRDMGCSFALDDFGVGFGTFTYLKQLPVDYLKIDIEFVRDLVGDSTNRHVVGAIIGAAKLFGMKTIAEGVEDQATQDALLEMGVDFAQGYWIGRPVPLTELWQGRLYEPAETTRSRPARLAP